MRRDLSLQACAHRSGHWAGTLARPLALALTLALASSGCANVRDPGDNNVGGPPMGQNPGSDPGNPGDPDNPIDDLTIEPGSPMVTVDGKTPYTLDFHVKKAGQDVTAQSTLTVDNDYFGSFQGATLHGNGGSVGKTRIRAAMGNETGSTTLVVRLKAVVVAPGAPPDSPGKFGGGVDPGKAPVIAYPPANALMPPNISELEFQWTPASATLFELRFVGDTIDLSIYTTCKTVGSGCSYMPDDATMKMLTTSARNGSLDFSMRGTTPGGGVGSAPAQKLSFSDSDMKGGLYYWAASAGGIARYDFGRRGQKAEPYYNQINAVAVCVGCHAMSRNGKRIAVGMNIPGPAYMRALDTATRGKLFEVGVGIISGSNYQAFSPDGSFLVTTETAGLTLRDGTSGMIYGGNPGLGNANMPDFSPDGKSIVFARSAVWCPFGPCTLSTSGASLYTVDFKGMAGFGMPKELVKSSGENNYYPGYSPDGRYVVFNRAGGDSYDAADARVMIVSAAGGTPIDLMAVNATTGNSWPKWSPFQHHFGTSPIMWLTFSSRRTYGVHTTANAQIWMLPVDTTTLDKGMESSYPPIWLPFQDLNTGNHIAQWVEEVERAPCTDNSGCSPNEVCQGGVCIPGIG
jgi:hypothetical protein